MSDQPDRALLEAKSRDDLVSMAAALGIEIAPRARKATIIDDILKVTAERPSLGTVAAAVAVEIATGMKTGKASPLSAKEF